MKITCDACGAKYSIADEKVAGKAFKIRCKKCTSSIVVRVEQPGAAAQAQPISSNEEKWHVVVNGEQQGPLTATKVGELLTSGAIDWDAYVWQEGFDDWKAARDIPELVAVLRSDGAPASAVDPIAGTPTLNTTGLFDANNDSDADDEVTHAQPPQDLHHMIQQASPALSRASAAAGADLFAQPAHEEISPASSIGDSGFGSGFGGGFGSAAMGSAKASKAQQTEPASGDALTGSRNETSVLFSLSNLNQLKTKASTEPRGAVANPGTSAIATTTNDASGLLDIRALAQAAASTGAASVQQKESPLVDSILQSHQGTVPLAPLSAPSLRPEPSGGSNTKFLMIGFAVVSLLALVAIGLLVVFLVNKPEPQTVATNTPTATGATPLAPGAPSEPGTAPSATAEPPNGSKEASAAANQEAAGKEGSRKEREHSSSRSSSSSKGSATPAPEPQKKPSGSIDDLLDQAIGGGGGSGNKASAAATSNLPDAPSRGDVMAAMRSVQGNVQSCGQGKSGIAQTSVKVSGTTGRVSNVSVSGVFAGTPTARCITNAVRGASFPKFKRSTFSFDYPFRL